MTPSFIIIATVLIVGLLWWLLITTEGVYLGRRTVIWLYDLYASRYDNIKQFLPDYDRILIANPMMERIAPHQSPLILDVATGTGRLPELMLQHPDFQGRIIGIDLSRKMLVHAAEKLVDDFDQLALIWYPAEKLPFENNTFDVVTCLEALEFMMNPQQVITELVRVLRPGGLLLVTNRINTRLMPGKIFKKQELSKVLATCGIEQIEVAAWQVDYQRVWGIKSGHGLSSGARPLVEVLRCPRCDGYFVEHEDASLVCEQCGSAAPLSLEGIVELYPLYPDNK